MMLDIEEILVCVEFVYGRKPKEQESLRRLFKHIAALPPGDKAQKLRDSFAAFAERDVEDPQNPT